MSAYPFGEDFAEAYSYAQVPPAPLRGWGQEQRSQIQAEIEEFLYYEADLLDQWRYTEWLELTTEDIRYWMPLRRNVVNGDWGRERTRPLSELAYFDENRLTLSRRVQQLQTGEHWAEEPRSRISHLVTNVRVTRVAPDLMAPQEVTVRSRFLVYRNHLQDEETTFIGKREDSLRRVGADWKLASRAIFLDQSVLLAQSITFFL